MNHYVSIFKGTRVRQAEKPADADGSQINSEYAGRLSHRFGKADSRPGSCQIQAGYLLEQAYAGISGA